MNIATVKLDNLGRLVVPRKIREEARIFPGQPLNIYVSNNKIEIEPVPLEVEFQRKGHFLTAVPKKKCKPLTNDFVEKTRQEIHENRK